MRKQGICLLACLTVMPAAAQFKLFGSSVKWDPTYAFDKANVFKIEFYARKNELMKTTRVRTFYQSAGENFSVRFEADRPGTGTETVVDRKNLVGIQMLGTGGGAVPLCTAGKFKYPEGPDLKKLELTATAETKALLGLVCRKYTYTHKKIFGEVWLTEQVTLPNDVGVFRAAKMAALHNTLSVPGFVMEMTTEDAGGGRTLMTTVSLGNDEPYTVDFSGISMKTALNTINYYTY